MALMLSKMVQRGGDVGAGVGGGGLWRQRRLAGVPRRLRQPRPEQARREHVHARSAAVHLVNGGGHLTVTVGQAEVASSCRAGGAAGAGRTAAGRKEFILVLKWAAAAGAATAQRDEEGR